MYTALEKRTTDIEKKKINNPNSFRLDLNVWPNIWRFYKNNKNIFTDNRPHFQQAMQKCPLGGEGQNGLLCIFFVCKKSIINQILVCSIVNFVCSQLVLFSYSWLTLDLSPEFSHSATRLRLLWKVKIKFWVLPWSTLLFQIPNSRVPTSRAPDFSTYSARF